jgi:succinoglycan biosynthesis protein ExoM
VLGPPRCATEVVHIAVCICTYKRPALLSRLLADLIVQRTDGTFTYSIVVADNDAAQSGAPIVASFAGGGPIAVDYCTEPRRNIALARNCAVAHARGDYVAWIDDDEYPTPDWLLHLFNTAQRHAVAAVVGPVLPVFAANPPRWLIEGRFCERPRYATGAAMSWPQSFAGNSLIRLDVLRAQHPPFRPEFGLGGEDVDFFRRAAAAGERVVWCDEAVVYEVVSAQRWTRRYRLKRALMLGRSAHRLEGRGRLVKSFVAVPLYALVMPATFIFGGHIVMKYAIKLCSHAGRILACLGVNPIGQRPE